MKKKIEVLKATVVDEKKAREEVKAELILFQLFILIEHTNGFNKALRHAKLLY